QDVEEYPRVPAYSVHTEHFAFPAVERIKIFSAPPETGWTFEVALEDASDPSEMLWFRGPFDRPLDLAQAMHGTRVVATRVVEKRSGTASWSEHEYRHHDSVWRQRLYAVTLFSQQRFDAKYEFVVTAQCKLERTAPLFALADRIVRDVASER